MTKEVNKGDEEKPSSIFRTVENQGESIRQSQRQANIKENLNATQ